MEYDDFVMFCVTFAAILTISIGASSCAYKNGMSKGAERTRDEAVIRGLATYETYGTNKTPVFVWAEKR